MHFDEAAQTYLNSLQGKALRRHLLPSAQADRAHDFSSNDYLGLAEHPEVIEAGMQFAARHGAGATGSRLLSGNLPCFEALEAQLAQFKCAQASLVFSSGYQANAGVLAALLDSSLWGGRAPLVFTDRLNHASLHHACQLAGVRQQRFRHNDLAHLGQCLAQSAGGPGEPMKIIATETVFGMDGDALPVDELAELALQHNALVYLDEAHATGIMGPQGRGLGAVSSPAIETLKTKGHWVVMGTFSKAVGVSGAYVAGSQALKDYLVNRCTGFVYSTAPSPFVVGAVSKALKLILEMDDARSQLLHTAQALRQALHALGFDTGHSSTQIVPIMVGDSAACLGLKQYLLDQGLVTSAIRPPTVPPNTARLRLALNCRHTPSVIEQLLDALQRWKTQCNTQTRS